MIERKTVAIGEVSIGYVERTPTDEWFGFYYHGLQKSKLFGTDTEAMQWVRDRDDEHLEYATHKLTGTIEENHELYKM